MEEVSIIAMNVQMCVRNEERLSEQKIVKIKTFNRSSLIADMQKDRVRRLINFIGWCFRAEDNLVTTYLGDKKVESSVLRKQDLTYNLVQLDHPAMQAPARRSGRHPRMGGDMGNVIIELLQSSLVQMSSTTIRQLSVVAEALALRVPKRTAELAIIVHFKVVEAV